EFAQPDGAVGDHADPDRGRDRRQVLRRRSRGALGRFLVAGVGGARRADEYPWADRADRAQHRARHRRHLDPALHDAGRDGARHDLHGRAGTGTMRDEAELNDLSEELAERRDRLIAKGIAARSVALTSILPGQDYVRLANEEEVDLIMLDGRRPLLGGGVPRGSVGHVLDQALCDVAVLVERQDTPTLDAGHPVMTPFGGGDHDWAAPEGAGLLVVGLSDRWRDEGLGPVRSEIAKSADAPTLFVRRGTRPGALAPRAGDVSRFAWSRA